MGVINIGVVWAVTKTIKDVFIIKIGNSTYHPKEDEVGNFVCKSEREGAELEEPFNAHSVEEWIIREFRLLSFQEYKIEVKVKLLEGA